MSFFRLLIALVAAGFLQGQPLSAETLMPMGSEWKFFPGTAHPGPGNDAEWRALHFDDSSWQIGTAPFSYGEPVNGTPLDDMRGSYGSVFFRTTFVLPSNAAVSDLKLTVNIDDGYVAWLNGVEISRFNMPGGDPTLDTFASSAVEPSPQTFTIPNPQRLLLPGANVLVVHAFNSSLSESSDFLFDAALEATFDNSAPRVTQRIPPAGATIRTLQQLEVHFTKAVTNVDAEDLLVNGTAATRVEPLSPTAFLFDLVEPGPGTIHVSWAANHQITDLNGVSFEATGWNYLLDPNAQQPTVVISEFMADNADTLNDEDGEPSDWIELYNNGSETVSLQGWYLTDSTNNLLKWRIPNVSLAPGTHLLIFASEKNRTNPLARLHTNFKLSAGGEYLALLNNTGSVIDEFRPVFPVQDKDVSYGRDGFDLSLRGYFTEPTPEAPNNASGPGFAGGVRFSRNGSTFLTPFNLELTPETPGATIRYTTNGTLPTLSSPIYSTPIPITGTVQVRARAFSPDLLPGPPKSEIYIRLNSNVQTFTSDLPLMIIDNFAAGSVPSGGDQFASVAVFEPNAGVTTLTNRPAVMSRAGINIRGSSTLGYPKSSYSIEFWNERDEDKEVSLLGLPEDSDWVLYAPNNFEPVLIHNPFMHALSRQVGRYSPRTRFVEVYVNRDGGPISSEHYAGIYVLEEKIKRSPDRVDVDKLEAEHVTPPEVTGGYLFKIDRPDPGDSGFNTAGITVHYVDPKEEEIELPQRDPQEQYVRNYFAAFYNALNSGNYRDPNVGYARYIDVPSWIDHHLLNVLAFNVDALRLSTYFYKPRNGKIEFGPLWDFDRALGSTDGRDSNPRVWRAPSGDLGTDFFNFTWWGRLFSDPAFWQAYIDRWQELRTGPFATTNLHALVDQMANQVRAAQPREQARWGIQPRGGSYSSEVNLMKDWLRNRVEWIDSQFLTRPTLGRAGGNVNSGTTVTLSGPAGSTIYYTLNGTDPRTPTGSISTSARAYSGPITISGNIRVIARAFNPNHSNLTGPNNPPISSSWSGVTAATFVVAPQPLVISEIMYNPPAMGTNSSDEFEYIELKNIGTTNLNLAGFAFTNGINFGFSTGTVATLPPGGLVVIAKNTNAYRQRYGSLANVAGQYVGTLDNAGERITLIGPAAEVVHDFVYQPSWHLITDGPGFSLTARNVSAPVTNWNSGSHWSPSSRYLGTPGSDDTTFASHPLVVVNELLAHTDPPALDAVELRNLATTNVDLTGWFLTDNYNNPRKYRFPAGTIIPANGYLVLDETAFRTGTNGFTFSSLGEEVFLFSGQAAGTNLTGYVHGFDFGASENGISFGRIVTSDGREHFVPLSSVSLGQHNSNPAVGPVIISEVHYFPPNVGTNSNTVDEFVELKNITPSAVRLFDPQFPTNRWGIKGGIDFVFPANVILPAEGTLLLVNFDPANTSLSNAFRTRFNVPAGVLLFGPYQGTLGDVNDRITLYRPDVPQGTAANPGEVPELLVERIDYSRSAPWPTNAAGTGFSIQRRSLVDFANDPANWLAAAPAAGRTQAVPTGDSDQDGLPDDWERQYGLDPNSGTGVNGGAGDADNDGLTNAQELLAGTDPRNAQSAVRISAISRTPQGMQLVIPVVAGKGYTVEVRDSFTTGGWTTLEQISAAQTAGRTSVTVIDPSAGTQRFYRVRLGTN